MVEPMVTPTRQVYYRKVFRIKAEDSPNVVLALAQKAVGKTPTNHEVVPGVVSWREYRKRRLTWDTIRQCIGLDAEFWEGADTLLFPPNWLNNSETVAALLQADVSSGKFKRDNTLLRSIGIDPAEGGDKTSITCVDGLGILELVSKKTPDTSVIVDEAISFINRWEVNPQRVVFDRGGGGKQHADIMRRIGYRVRTVAFGETIGIEPKRGIRTMDQRIDIREEKFAYVNRRAQMYHELRLILDPGLVGPDSESGRLQVFAIPAKYTELRRQIAPIPLTFDQEGRVKLMSKSKRSENSTEKTLVELLGCSPDETDSLALAVHGLLHMEVRIRAGAV